MTRRKSGDETGPIAYDDEARRADRQQGREDGRKQLPTYTKLMTLIENGERITSPYTERLANLGLHEIGGLLVQFHQRTSDRYKQLDQKRAQVDTTIEAIGRGVEEIETASAPLTEDELRPRSPQEMSAAGRPAMLSRRGDMRDKRIAEARERQRQRQRAVDTLRAEMAAIGAEIDREFATTQARGRKLGDYYVSRISGYWEGVTQTHPEGRHMATLLAEVVPTLPWWIDATCVGGEIRMPAPPEPTEEDIDDAEEDL